ncbi:MAG: hypothetical protein OEY14_09155 [Myxococcales bacterium]|nr:hypothetical protein [Myxococcales bacterium]
MLDHEESGRRARRALLWVALGLTLSGSCGISSGLSPFVNEGQAEITPESEEEAQLSRLSEAMLDPRARAIAAANLVVSALLLIASSMLLLRRSSAIWWVTQAVAANCVWIALSASSMLAHLRDAEPEIVSIFMAMMETSEGDAEPAAIQAGAEILFSITLLVVVIGGLVRILVHLLLLYRARRPDLRALLGASVDRSA